MIASKGSGTATALALSSGSTAPVSEANEFELRYNEALSQPEISVNGGPWVPLPSGSTGGVIVVADTTALAAYDDAPLVNSTPAWVASKLGYFILNKNDTLSPIDGRRVVGSSDGKRWLRVLSPMQYWLDKPMYYISAGGNDDNEGDIGTPLATFDEVRCRMAGGVVSIPQTVHFVGIIHTEDIIVDWSHADVFVGTAYLLLEGERHTILYAGTCGAGTTAYDPAGGTFGEIEDAGVPSGAWSTSGCSAKFFVMTSGPNTGYVGMIIGETPGDATKAYYMPLVDVVTETTDLAPLPGETYDVYSITRARGRFEIQNANAFVKTIDLFFESLDAAEVAIQLANGGKFHPQISTFNGHNAFSLNGYIDAIGCRFALVAGTSFVVEGGVFISNGCWFETTGLDLRHAAALGITGNTVFLNGTGGTCGIACRLSASCQLLAWACWLDSTGPAVTLDEKGVLYCVVGRLWGDLPSGGTSAIQVRRGGEMFYAAAYPPAITGATDDVRIGASLYAYVDLPVANYPHGVVYQTE